MEVTYYHYDSFGVFSKESTQDRFLPAPFQATTIRPELEGEGFKVWSGAGVWILSPEHPEKVQEKKNFENTRTEKLLAVNALLEDEEAILQYDRTSLEAYKTELENLEYSSPVIWPTDPTETEEEEDV